MESKQPPFAERLLLAERFRERQTRELLLLCVVEVLAGELLLEAFNATERIDEGLLASEEGMRAAPHFNVERRHGRADGHDDLAAEGHLAIGVVLRVDFLLHDKTFRNSTERPTWSPSGVGESSRSGGIRKGGEAEFVEGSSSPLFTVLSAHLPFTAKSRERPCQAFLLR